MIEPIGDQLLNKDAQAVDHAYHITTENKHVGNFRKTLRAGKSNMLFGALWCIGGIIVTAFSYQATMGAGGGKYIIAWGAIVFGGIQFFRGLIQVSGH